MVPITRKKPRGWRVFRSREILFLYSLCCAALGGIIGCGGTDKASGRGPEPEYQEKLEGIQNELFEQKQYTQSLEARIQKLESGAAAQTLLRSDCSLKADIQQELAAIDAFFKARESKSPAHDSAVNRSEYSDLMEAYAVETSRQYVEKFWLSIQPLLQRAVAVSVKPEGTEGFARAGWYPEPKWWQAMLNPGYKELVAIQKQLPGCG